MIFIRSLIFNIAFYALLIIFLIVGLPTILGPRMWSIRALQLWGHTMNVLLRVICNIKVEVRGLDKIPQGACILAGKHQSVWETFAATTFVDDPCMVLKKELTYIPLMGFPYMWKFRMIGLDRGSGAKAMRSLIAQAKEAIALRRQIIILPEGTRRPVGAPPDYKPGAAALYTQLGVPCVPFGLNAGLCWPRRQFIKRPGTIVVQFGEVIPPGLSRRDFEARMISEIESLTKGLGG